MPLYNFSKGDWASIDLISARALARPFGRPRARHRPLARDREATGGEIIEIMAQKGMEGLLLLSDWEQSQRWAPLRSSGAGVAALTAGIQVSSAHPYGFW